MDALSGLQFELNPCDHSQSIISIGKRTAMVRSLRILRVVGAHRDSLRQESLS